MKICIKCGEEIPAGRVKALPNIKVCVGCSTTNKVSGFMSWEHKTAPSLNICSAEDADKVYKLTRRRGQGVIPGIRMKGH